MRPEEVPAEMVERVARALESAYHDAQSRPVSMAMEGLFTVQARHALAAVLPDIQAQALEDAADGMHSAQHTGCFRMTCPDCREFRVRTDVRAYLRSRAARLTTTTDGTTT